MGHSAAKYLLTVGLALTLSACLSEDDESSSAVDLSITSPVGTSAMDTTDPSVSLAGTAESANGVSLVSWKSDRGAEGVADGTDSWQTGSIALELGDNRITVTAEDAAGETASRSITVNRESGQKSSATISWQAPTTREDGSPLTNLAGYIVYYGRMSGIYDYQIDIANPGIVTYVVEDLVSGDWYFALAAYDANGLVSERSAEVLREIS